MRDFLDESWETFGPRETGERGTECIKERKFVLFFFFTMPRNTDAYRVVPEKTTHRENTSTHTHTHSVTKL